MPKLARRITETSKKSFGMYARAAALGPAGDDLIHLELGKPIHDTPQHIKDAAIAALRAGKVHYGDLQGEPEFRAALANKLTAFNGLDYSPGEVLVTNGLTHASFAAFLALVDPGDEVILLEPYYPQHLGKIELAGGTVVTVPLDAEAGFSIRADWLEAAITPRTKMIVLVNPCNPTGRVYSPDELMALADVAIRHDLFVVSDEVYEFITFDDRRHTSIASLPGMRDRTVSMFAFTKSHAMDGWRLGYLAADAALMPGLMKITANDATHVNTFIQSGGLAAVTAGDGDAAEMVADDQGKRDLLVRALNQMPGVRCAPPEGTIYAFPDVRGTGRSSQALADALLEEARVVVEAGSFYGAAGEGYLRLCFGSVTHAELDEAITRLSRFFNTLA
ncbi:pyridoxal phosphate-dependent aminotransferase [Sphingomonas sp. dw_22]|uniref:pyridoxal phosphate-dependent aminotransferase n=1 Tax=Sphingomonas sp. dw_22 TaxID=2721175 RepID=UPI0031FF1121